jgi:hypothetical protein
MDWTLSDRVVVMAGKLFRGLEVGSLIAVLLDAIGVRSVTDSR